MGDIVFNNAKGRVAELYNRVDSNDPVASTLVIIPIDAGAVSDATARDQNTFADLVTAGVTERTATGWNRKTLADTDLAAMTVDDALDRMQLDLADQTWTAVSGGAGNAVTDLVICYASIASPTNADLTCLTMHDFVITPDGTDVTATITDFYRAA